MHPMGALQKAFQSLNYFGKSCIFRTILWVIGGGNTSSWFDLLEQEKLVFFSEKDHILIFESSLMHVACVYCCSFGLCWVYETTVWQNVFGSRASSPLSSSAWIWGRLDSLPTLHFSRQLSKSTFFLSLFQRIYYGELHFLSLQHVLIYRMRFVIIEFRAECWAFSISPGVFLGTRWIAQYASGKK